MTGWLALVGGDEWRPGCDFDAALLAASGGDEVVVLPTAAAFEQPDRAVDSAARWFAGLGGRVTPCPVLHRSDAEDPRLVAQVRSARFLYLSGGSPMHLRSVLDRSPVWDAVAAAWRDGAVLAGSSAGAMVLGDTLVDARGGGVTLGIGFVPGLAVVPHAESWSPERTRRTLKLAGPAVTVARIDARTALLRSPEGVWSVAGAGGVQVHRAGRPGEADEVGLTLLDDLALD